MFSTFSLLKDMTHGPRISIREAQVLEGLRSPVHVVEPAVPGHFAVSGMRMEEKTDADGLYKAAQALRDLSSRMWREALPAQLVQVVKAHYVEHGGKPNFSCQTCRDHNKVLKKLPSSQLSDRSWFLETPATLDSSALSAFFYCGGRRKAGNVIVAGCDPEKGEALIGFGDEAGYIHFIRVNPGQGIVAPVARFQCFIFNGLLINFHFPHTRNNLLREDAFKVLTSGALATYHSPEEGWRRMGNCLSVYRNAEKVEKVADITPDNLESLGAIRVPLSLWPPTESSASIESAGKTEGHPLLEAGAQPTFSATIRHYWPDHAGVEHVLVSSIFREPA